MREHKTYGLGERTRINIDTKEREPWPSGPWDREPDRIDWTSDTDPMPRLMLRNRMGGWCGYVGVLPGHPWHGKDYGDVPVEVHGGLTFSDGCEGDPPYRICHIPLPGQPDDVWWLGFDCGHFMDLLPGMPMFNDIEPPIYEYRTEAYVKAEVERLAAQVRAAA